MPRSRPTPDPTSKHGSGRSAARTVDQSEDVFEMARADGHHARNRSPRRPPSPPATDAAPAALLLVDNAQTSDDDELDELPPPSTHSRRDRDRTDRHTSRPKRLRQHRPVHSSDSPTGGRRPRTRGRLSDDQRIIALTTLLVLLVWLLLSNPPRPPNRAVDALRRKLSAHAPLTDPFKVTLRHYLFLPGDPSKGVALVPDSLGLVWANQSVAGGIEWFDFESPDLIPSAAPVAAAAAGVIGDGGIALGGGVGVNQTVVPSIRRVYAFGRVKWVAAVPGAPYVVAWSSISSNLTMFHVPPTGRIVPKGRGFLVDEEDVQGLCTGSVPMVGPAGRNTTVALVQKGGFIRYFGVDVGSGEFTPLRTVAIPLRPSEFITSCTLSPQRPHVLDFSTTFGTLASINMTTLDTSSQPPRPILTADQWTSLSFPGFPLPPPTSTAWPLLYSKPSPHKVQSMLALYSTDLASELLLVAHKSGTFTLLARTDAPGTSRYMTGWWLVARFTLAPPLPGGGTNAGHAAAAASASTRAPSASAMDLTALPMGARFPNGVWTLHVKKHPESGRPGYWMLPLEQVLGALDLKVLSNVSPMPPADDTAVLGDPRAKALVQSHCGCAALDHGVCVNGKCECYQGWSGQDCSVPAATCHARNATVAAPGVCACPGGWAGMHCDHVAVPANLTLVPQLRHASDNDDAAIYVHPTHPKAAVALGTTKSHEQAGEGGVHVWLLDGGKEVGFVEVPQGAGVNSINVLYGVEVENGSERKIDLVVASVRGSVNGVAVWKIDPQALLTVANITSPSTNATPKSTAVLTPLSSFLLPMDPAAVEVYGSCAFSSSSPNSPTRIQHSVVLPTKQGRAHHFHLTLRPNTTHTSAPPIPFLSRVRSWRVGRGSQLENCQADPDLGILYIGEEGVGVWAHDMHAPDVTQFEWMGTKWPPELGAVSEQVSWPRLIGATVNSGVPGGTLRMDIEGLGLYVTPKSKRKLLVVSSQGQNAFVMFDVTNVRTGPTPRLVSIRIMAGGKGVDEVTKTDSLSVTSAAVGGYASGALVVHDDATTEAGDVAKVSGEATFKVVDWQEVAKRVKDELPEVDLLD